MVFIRFKPTIISPFLIFSYLTTFQSFFILIHLLFDSKLTWHFLTFLTLAHHSLPFILISHTFWNSKIILLLVFFHTFFFSHDCLFTCLPLSLSHSLFLSLSLPLSLSMASPSLTTIDCILNLLPGLLLFFFPPFTNPSLPFHPHSSSFHTPLPSSSLLKKTYMPFIPHSLLSLYTIYHFFSLLLSLLLPISSYARFSLFTCLYLLFTFHGSSLERTVPDFHSLGCHHDVNISFCSS